VSNRTENADFTVRHRLSPRQVAMVLAGGQIALVCSQQST
jgi:aconitate hydratase